MKNMPVGSHLTRAMLKQEDKPVWCCVSDNSDEEAIKDLVGNDFMLFITSYQKEHFYCTDGMAWSFAVPIKIVVVTEMQKALSKNKDTL